MPENSTNAVSGWDSNSQSQKSGAVTNLEMYARRVRMSVRLSTKRWRIGVSPPQIARLAAYERAPRPLTWR